MDIYGKKSNELVDLYRTGFQIASANIPKDIYQTISQLFQKTTCVAGFLSAEKETLTIQCYFNPNSPKETPATLKFEIAPESINSIIRSKGPIFEKVGFSSLPNDLLALFPSDNLQQISLIPVKKGPENIAYFCFGSIGKQIPLEELAFYTTFSELIGQVYENIDEKHNSKLRLDELEAITQTSQLISSSKDLRELYETLHAQIRKTIGDYSFLIALYDPSTTAIQVPYMYEDDQVTSIEAFPLGEGLTSIVLRTLQPLLIVKETEKKAAALGAKIVGKTAKSWLGVPLIVAGEATGAIIIQDTMNEDAFSERDMQLLTTLASQVAGAIFNVRILDETRTSTIQLQTAAEIARDISTSLDLNELLSKAVKLIRERFDFYHSAIFMIDNKNEFAAIREATGDAGLQLKKANHKLAVGSNSIVGYVSGTGESLVVNDTSRDITYYANPLLPNTRAEVGIPLRVGERVLGVLDVQSTLPYSFTDDKIRVLQILADQLSIAIINSDLFSETQEHLSQHRLLYHVTSAAASGSSLDEALNSSVQGIQVTLGGDRVVILLLNKEFDCLELRSAVGYSEDALKIKVPLGTGITGWVAENKKLLRVNDVTKDDRYITLGSNVRSELALPLIYRGELLGVLNVESDKVDAYNENDEELLTTLGGSLAAIIANARLIEQIRNQANRERRLYEITERIRRANDTQTILAIAAEEITNGLDVQRTHIKIEPIIN
jgi:GAF domain-containing protein